MSIQKIKPLKIKVGDIYGRLTFLRHVGRDKMGELWECRCVCGNIKIYHEYHITRTSQHVRSCGCLNSELASTRMKRHNSKNGLVFHGEANMTKEYRAWKAMTYVVLLNQSMDSQRAYACHLVSHMCRIQSFSWRTL